MALSLYSTTTDHANGSSRTVSADMGSGSDRLCVVLVSCTWETVSSVTVGGSNATQEIARLNSGMHSYIYTYVAPSTGSRDVVVTFSAACNSVITVLVFNGVHQTTPVTDSDYSEGTGTGPSLTLTSGTDEVCIDCLAWNGDSASATASEGGGQTVVHNYRYPAAYCAGAHSYKAGASSVTMSWTLSASRDYALTAIAIQPSPSVTEALAGSVSGAATQTASLKNTRRVTGSPSAATVASTVALRLYRRWTVSVTGASGLSQAMKVGRFVTGSVGATSATAQTLRVRWGLGGAVASTSASTQSVNVLRKMVGAAAGVSLGTYAIRVVKRMEAGVSSLSTTLGIMGQRIAIGASLAAQSVLEMSFTLYRRVAGAVSGIGSVTGAAWVMRKMAAVLGSVSGLASALRRTARVTGAVGGAASVMGTLITHLVEVIEALAGAVVAAATVSASAWIRHGITAVTGGAASLVGAVTKFFRGSGEANTRLVTGSRMSAILGERLVNAPRKVSIAGRGRMVRSWR